MSKIVQNILYFIKNMPRGWLDAFQHYLYYQGRTNREGFLSFAIINSMIAYFLFILNDALGLVYRIHYGHQYIDFYLLFTTYILLSITPSFCLCIRRLHDLNLSGWWFLLWLCCLIISLPYLYLNFLCQWFLLLVAIYPSSNNHRFGYQPIETFTV